MPSPIILLLFFFSGVSGLMYEVLWLKELSLLFGNASYAMATTLAAFFSGLALGGYQWGKRVRHVHNSLRLYACLELGIAICAVGYFFILELYAALYPQLYQSFGSNLLLLTALKFFLAMLILLPPAWFMGGTLPVLSHYVVKQKHQLGQFVTLLYVSNTLGAVLGVFLAGFYLPAVIGYFNSYAVAMLICLIVASWVFYLSRQTSDVKAKPTKLQLVFPENFAYLQSLAFFSGLFMLALQVLWGRMFAQVLQNSVYTFALILLVFLVCLALGAGLASRLMRSCVDARKVMFYLLLGGAFLVATTPFIFMQLSNNMHYIGVNQGWENYIWQVVLHAFIVMAPAILVLACVFPYVLKLCEREGLVVGNLVGRLSSINHVGSITGSLLAGFVILDSIGLWAGIRLIAILYAIVAWLWLYSFRHNTRLAVLPALLIVLTVSVLDTSRLPLVSVNPVIDQESVLQVWEGSSGTVAVIKQRDDLKLKVNNYYTLGGSASFELEQLQGYLPLLLHENPESVYILGLGSGITAGGSLLYPIKKLLVTELIGDVVTASDQYFGEYTNSLFYDPRVEIVVEDGRNYLRATRQHFDVIISDLFVPWKAGVGNLYALQHYQSIQQHLKVDGLFMQWLPAYQLSRDEFDVIAHTMLQVFPQVTVWRAGFGALRPVIGLLAHNTKQPLSKQAWLFTQQHDKDIRLPDLSHYMGDLAALQASLASTPINTDDFPVIEFQAPVTQQQSKTGTVKWLVGDALFELMQDLRSQQDGTYLSAMPAEMLSLPEAGMHLQHAQILQQQGKLMAKEQAIQRYQAAIKQQ